MEDRRVEIVVHHLLDCWQTNNLAARIDVLFRASKSKRGFRLFNKDQIYDVRVIARENSDVINTDIMETIEEIADYFEAVIIAEELEREME